MFAPKTVIEGLRGVGRVELAFEPGQPAHVLLGGNGVGKTKSLEALFQIAFGAYLKQSNWKGSGLGRDYLVFDSVTSKNWEVNISSKNSYPFFFFNQHVVDEALPSVFAGSQNRGFVEPSTRKSGSLGTAEQIREAYVARQLQGMKNGFTSLNMESGIEQWFVARAQSAHRYQKFEDNRGVEIEAVLKLMHRLDVRVDPEFLEISGDEKVTVRVDGHFRQIDQLSSGFSSLLKLVQTIVAGYGALTNDREIRNVRGRVFIDEIESHLHLSWQSRIVRLLVELFPNTTFYITTHSALVTAQCRRGEAYLLEPPKDDLFGPSDNGVVRTRLIEAPGTAALADLLGDAFGVDVNKLKLERMDPDRQRAAKAALLDLLREDVSK